MAGIILIVDDAQSGSTALELALDGLLGFPVRVCADSRAGLQLALSGVEEVRAVVTDLQMPHLDGFELIARLRGHAGCSAIPIVVVSGDANPETPSRVLALGADAYFPKPYSPAAVRRKLEQLLNEPSR